MRLDLQRYPRDPLSRWSCSACRGSRGCGPLDFSCRASVAATLRGRLWPYFAALLINCHRRTAAQPLWCSISPASLPDAAVKVCRARQESEGSSFGDPLDDGLHRPFLVSQSVSERRHLPGGIRSPPLADTGLIQLNISQPGGCSLHRIRHVGSGGVRACAVSGSQHTFRGSLTMSLLIMPIIIITAQRSATQCIPFRCAKCPMLLGATRWQTVSGT